MTDACRRQREQWLRRRDIVRHDASDTPHRSQSGGVSRVMASQQRAQTLGGVEKGLTDCAHGGKQYGKHGIDDRPVREPRDESQRDRGHD